MTEGKRLPLNESSLGESSGVRIRLDAWRAFVGEAPSELCFEGGEGVG